MAGEAAKLRGLASKVRALIPVASELRLATDEEALLEAMGFAARPGPRPALNAAVDDAIAEALKGPFRLKIDYQSRTDGVPMWRIVEPMGLLLGARRYLIGIDTAKRDGRFRHYRVEDIRSAELVDQSFAMPADFDLRDYATRAFGSFHNDAEFGEVIWRFSSEAADRARRYTFHPGQEVRELADGGLEVRFHASGHLEMAWHLYSWGGTVEVIEPAGLANLVHPFRRSDFAALP